MRMRSILAFVIAAVTLLAERAPAQPTAQRSVEPVIVSGAKLAGWSGPQATVVCQPYPSGALTGERDAHNGIYIAPPAIGVPVDQIAAYRWDTGTCSSSRSRCRSTSCIPTASPTRRRTSRSTRARTSS